MKAPLLPTLLLSAIISSPLYASENETTTETAVTSETTETSASDDIRTVSSPVMTQVSEASALTVATAAIDNGPKFSISPMLRVLADGAVYFPDGHGFTDGVNLPDIRIGAKASYGNWSAKVDLGFGYFKFSAKDIFIQYKFNDENLLRLGYFVHQFGLQASTSSSFKAAMEAPVSDSYFNATGRNLGLMYVLDKPNFFMGLSAVFGNIDDMTENKITRASVGAVGRFVWRPIAEPGAMVQVGISGWYQSPTYKRGADGQGHGLFGLKVNYPTRVVKVQMLGAEIDNAGNQLKISPELLLCKDRVALESQYYYMNVNRHAGLPSYVAQGAYAWLRCLLFGDTRYNYSHADAGIACPGPKTLEVVLGYDYTNASHKAIRGGISNDMSLTFNYYINKYLLCRLGYRYATARDSECLAEFGGKRHVNMIQARIQFKF